MLRHCQYFVSQTRVKLLKFRDELCIEVFCNLIESVPLGIIWPHHGCPHPCPSTFMMPELVVSPLYLFIELCRSELPLFFELLHRGLCWLSELLVVEGYSIVVLLVEIIHPFHSMTGLAYVLHRLPPVLPVFELL